MLREALESMGGMFRKLNRPMLAEYKYQSPEELVATLGKTFVSQALTEDEHECVVIATEAAQREGIEFVPKACFYNAQLLTLHDPLGLLTYVEGYFTRPTIGIPIHHGWISINGKVVDPTIRVTPVDQRKLTKKRKGKKAFPFTDHNLGTFPEGFEYLGVEFPDRDAIRTRIVATGQAGSLILDEAAGYPLLKGA